jgi:hypothetical protein
MASSKVETYEGTQRAAWVKSKATITRVLIFTHLLPNFNFQ